MFDQSTLSLSTAEYFNYLIEFYKTKPQYTYDEVYEASEEYFNGDDIAAKVFVDKYALQDNDGNFYELTPDDMHDRIAKEFARIEAQKFKNPMSYDEIYSYLKNFKYIVPQGSPMYGIGNPFQYITLSNCYVIEPPVDSYGGIMKADQELVQISKRRGGVGADISLLRPEGYQTKNAARTTTGVLSFAERFSNSIREVGQNGRRGALMLTLDVHHPNVREFIESKTDLGKITGANISVRLSDKFLSAVDKDEEYELIFDNEIVKSIPARDVWHLIIENAWKSAEPGVLFWDNIVNNSPTDCYQEFQTKSTNPCSEIPLSPFDSCRLLLQNLYSYVVNPFTDNAYFDFDLYSNHVQIAQRFMDNLIDLELEMIDRIINKIESDPEDSSIKSTELGLWRTVRTVCYRGRRTGTGVTAVGDAVAAAALGYGTPESLDFIEAIYKTLKLNAYRSSVDMAKELGSFPAWDAVAELNNPFLLQIKEEDPQLWEDMQKYGRRNIALLTTAPTGSVSIMTQTSGGIEPEFSIQPYTRRKKGNPGDQNFRSDFVDQNGDHWMEFLVIKPKLKDWMEITGEDNIEKSPWHGFTANDLNWETRVELQGRAQKHVDHAISSTVNLPNDVSVEEVGKIYLAAWKHGCKGITIYRDGCRTGVLVRNTEQEKKDTIQKTDAPKRPNELTAEIHHTKYKGIPYFVIIGLFNGEPYEVFAGHNGFLDKKYKTCDIKKIKRGHYTALVDGENIVDNISDHVTDDEAAICRLLSLSLRHGADIAHCVTTMQKVPGDMNSFGKVIARILKKYIPDDTKVTGFGEGEGTYVFREGCVVRLEDGWTACS